MSEKVFQDYLNARNALVESRLKLTKELLKERYFFKHIEVYFNGERIILSRIDDYPNNEKLTYWVGPVSGVCPFSKKDLFVQNLSYELDSMEKNHEKWKINFNLEI